MATMRSLTLFILLVSSLLTCNGSEDILSCLFSRGVENFTTLNNPSYYHFLNFSFYSLRFSGRDYRKPFAVILPANKQQLVVAVQCSRKWNWVIRLRSGGHDFEGTSSVANEPFVIIDMMNLNRVTVDLESETAWVEGGATLGEVYHAIGMSSKVHAFPAGTSPTVGVGGHLSGGGNGMLARKYGEAADNVVDAILIDGDGNVFDRETMPYDVFWAIRGGGGGSWGAIYAWKIQLVRVPENVTAFSINRNKTRSSAVDLVNKWQLVAPVLEDDFFLEMLVTVGTKSSDISMTFLGLYQGPKASAFDSISRNFPELGAAEHDLIEMSWIESIVYHSVPEKVSTVDDLMIRSYPKAFIKCKFDYVRDPIPIQGLEAALEMFTGEPKSIFSFIPYGGMVGRIASDEIAFPHRKGNLYSIIYMFIWNEVDNWRSNRYLDRIHGLYEYMTPFVSKDPRAVYVNNVDLDLGVMDWMNDSISRVDAVEIARAWGEKYFLGHYDRLVNAKTLIDLNNVFRHPQSIPPLSNSKGLK